MDSSKKRDMMSKQKNAVLGSNKAPPMARAKSTPMDHPKNDILSKNQNPPKGAVGSAPVGNQSSTAARKDAPATVSAPAAINRPSAKTVVKKNPAVAQQPVFKKATPSINSGAIQQLKAQLNALRAQNATSTTQYAALVAEIKALSTRMELEKASDRNAFEQRMRAMEAAIAKATHPQTPAPDEAEELSFVSNNNTAPTPRPGQRRPVMPPADAGAEKFSDHHLEVLENFGTKFGTVFSAVAADSSNVHAGLTFHIPAVEKKGKQPATPERAAFTIRPSGVIIHAPDHDDTLKASIILAVQMHQGNFKVISTKPGEAIGPAMQARIRKATEELMAAGLLVDHNGKPFPNPVTLNGVPVGVTAPPVASGPTGTSRATVAPTSTANARGPATATPTGAAVIRPARSSGPGMA
jgi:hypothetical protein